MSDPFLMNHKANCHNRFQGRYKKVLCVCSAGLLRSPTAALVLSQEPYNFNTRAAGLVEEFAPIPVDDVLLEWADQIVCMTPEQKIDLKARTKKPIMNLNTDDAYAYRQPELIELIKLKYDKFKDKS